ncbi:MAG: RNA methyltransferase, partial [Desulfuromonadaceae bacterium]|nr:RNA methyltransferase [Desulfuromonadaceae bacterium]
PFSPESPLQIDLYQALPQRERFELILEKATEIGVSRIIPFCSGRSITLEERDARQRKSHRWPDLLLRAAKQCRRGTIPELLPVLSWEEALADAGGADLVLALAEREEKRRLRDIVRQGTPMRHVALWVGPEGGFEPEEQREMDQAGFAAVSLGGRILRTETAALAGAVMVQHLLGDLG